MRKTNAQYLAETLKELEGATLIGFDIYDMEDHNDGLGLSFRLADGRYAMVDVYRDEEGNGPGWLNLNPIVEAQYEGNNRA